MNQQNWPQSRRPLILISLNLKGTPVKCEVIWVQRNLNHNNKEESRKTPRNHLQGHVPDALAFLHHNITVTG